MGELKNRLQFVHHSDIFATKEEALKYIMTSEKKGGAGIKSLYGEPIMLKYSADTEADGYRAILVIGSETNDDDYGDNRFVVIDPNELSGNVSKISVEIVDMSGNVETMLVDIKNLKDKFAEISAMTDFNVSSSSTVNLTMSESNGQKTLVADVKIADANKLVGTDTSKNLIIVGEGGGITANIEFDYDSLANQLKIYRSNHDAETIQLNSAQVIDSIEYSAENESLIIKYHTSVGEEKTITVPLANLIEEWDVDNSIVGGIQLTKTRAINGKDILTAKLLSASDNDNIFTIHDNGGYVSGKQISANTEAINSEITRAKAAEETNAKAIADETVRATEAEGLNAGVISDEITRAKTAEEANAKAIVDETVRAKTAEEANAKAIADETVRATEAEGLNADAITNEAARAKAAEETNAKAIADETVRAKAAEETNAKAIADETVRATEAEGLNAGVISDEITRAKTAEEANAKAIVDETVRAKTAEEANAKAIADETVRATEAEGLNADAITNEAARAKAAEETNAKAIADETVRAKAAEETNAKAIADETVRATEAEGLNAGVISDEITRAKTAEAALQNSLTLEGGETNSAKITVENQKITADVKVSDADGNIVRKLTDAGLFASTDISYNAATNVITYSKSNSTGGTDSKDITLNAGSIVKDMYITESGSSEYLVIKYDTTNGTSNEIKIDVSKFFEPWDVATNNLGGIVLSKTHDDTVNRDVLTAVANISTGDTNNILINDKGTLKADATGIKSDISNLSGQVVSNTNKIIEISGEVLTISSTVVSNSSKYDIAISALSASVSAQTSANTVDISVLSSQTSSISSAVTALEAVSGTFATKEYVDGQDKAISGQVSANTVSINTLSGQVLDNELVVASALTQMNASDGFGTDGKYIQQTTDAILSAATNLTNADVALSQAIQNAKASSTTDISSLSGEVATLSGQVSANTAAIKVLQDNPSVKYSAGEGIEISTGNVISVSGDYATNSGLSAYTYSKEVLDAKFAAGTGGTVDLDAYAKKTDLESVSGTLNTSIGTKLDITAYTAPDVTKSYVDAQDSAISGQVSANTVAIKALQDNPSVKYSAGEGIEISTGNVISVSGGYAANSALKDVSGQVSANTANISALSAQTSVISSAVTALETVSGSFATTTYVNAQDSAISGQVSANTAAIKALQDNPSVKYSAGTGIAISADNIISVSGDYASNSALKDVSGAVSTNTTNISALSAQTSANTVDISVLSSQTSIISSAVTALEAASGGFATTTYVNAQDSAISGQVSANTVAIEALQTAVAGTKYSAGTGIAISTDNVISVSGDYANNSALKDVSGTVSANTANISTLSAQTSANTVDISALSSQTSTISSAVTALEAASGNFATTTYVNAQDSAISGQVSANTEAIKAIPKYTAGTGITISGNAISVYSGYTYTQAEIDQKLANIQAGGTVDLTGYATKDYVNTQDDSIRNSILSAYTFSTSATTDNNVVFTTNVTGSTVQVSGSVSSFDCGNFD
jgi:hypothetical protein